MIHLLWVLVAAEEIQIFCQKNGWSFCFIGGLAVQRWGEPRMTQDADLTLLTGFGNEESFIDPLLSAYSPRRPDAREFALAHRVLLLNTTAGFAGWGPNRSRAKCNQKDSASEFSRRTRTEPNRQLQLARFTRGKKCFRLAPS